LCRLERFRGVCVAPALFGCNATSAMMHLPCALHFDETDSGDERGPA
jgi:hypothetical protein